MKRVITLLMALIVTSNAHAFGLWGSADMFHVGGITLPGIGAQTSLYRFDDGLPLGAVFVRDGGSDGGQAWNPLTGVRTPGNLITQSDIMTTVAAADIYPVDAGNAHFVSFVGTGSITLTGAGGLTGTLTGTGVNNRVELAFTPSTGQPGVTFTPSGDVRQVVAYRGAYTEYVRSFFQLPYHGPRLVTTPKGKGVLVERTAANIIPSNNTTPFSLEGINGSGVVQTGTYYGDYQVLRMTENTSSSQHGGLNIIGKSASAITYTFSATIPSTNGRTQFALRLSDAGANWVDAVFDVSAGTVVRAAGATGNFTAISQSIRPEAGGYRCSVTATTNTGTLIVPYLLGAVAGNTTYLGTGAALDFIMPQLEALPYSTSPIVRLAGAQTRTAEKLTQPVYNTISPISGAAGVWVKVRPEVQSYAATAYLLGTTSGSDKLELYHNAVANQWTASVSNGTGTSTHTVTAALSEGWHLIGMEWSAGVLQLVLDGVKQASPTASPKLPASLPAAFAIGSDGAGTDGTQANMIIDELVTFSRPLSDSEWLKAYNQGVNKYVPRTPAYMVAWGDSLTFGYPDFLSADAGRYTLNRGFGGRNSSEILERFNLEPEHRGGVQVIWSGHNNTGSNAQADQTMTDIAAMVSKLGHNHYVVMTMIKGTAARPPSSIYNVIEYGNARILAEYPNNSLDILAYLLTQGTGEGQDAIDVADGIVPASLRVDSIHLTAAGYALVAQKVADFIAAKGW